MSVTALNMTAWRYLLVLACFFHAHISCLCRQFRRLLLAYPHEPGRYQLALEGGRASYDLG